MHMYVFRYVYYGSHFYEVAIQFVDIYVGLLIEL